jgi:hypothetical protein
MPGNPIFSRISWEDNDILLVGTIHGAHTYHEKIVNELENFQPSIVLVEGNELQNAPVEHRSAKNYSAISGAEVKPLNTSSTSGEYRSYKNMDEEDYKEGIIDDREAGYLISTLRRYVNKVVDEGKYDRIFGNREGDMIYKMTYELERNNHNRIAVIFGKSHIHGIKKIFRDL